MREGREVLQRFLTGQIIFSRHCGREKRKPLARGITCWAKAEGLKIEQSDEYIPRYVVQAKRYLSKLNDNTKSDRRRKVKKSA